MFVRHEFSKKISKEFESFHFLVTGRVITEKNVRRYDYAPIHFRNYGFLRKMNKLNK